MEEMILEFTNVTGSKGKFRLQDISFSLQAGYMMGLMGANGAGKSTLMSYIMREDAKYTGTIKMAGQDIRENHAYMRNFIGFVSEDNGFFESLSPMDNVNLMARFYENFDKELFQETMKEMGVALSTMYYKLSRGEKLKFQMAFAMAHHPKLYLLDEVTVGMDPVFRLDFFKILHKVIETGEASVLMTSHIESEMKQRTDFLGIMDEGRLTWFGESLDYRQEA
ncbi:MAG: ABC transporter ATP-binding protein [Lachnospiraceae bacterium]|nr:ABC transporter ATP-binding protein [Lachnospiraceae bacterium]